MLVHLLQPVLQRLEALFIGDVIDQEDAMAAPEISICHSTELRVCVYVRVCMCVCDGVCVDHEKDMHVNNLQQDPYIKTMMNPSLPAPDQQYPTAIIDMKPYTPRTSNHRGTPHHRNERHGKCGAPHTHRRNFCPSRLLTICSLILVPSRSMVLIFCGRASNKQNSIKP